MEITEHEASEVFVKNQLSLQLRKGSTVLFLHYCSFRIQYTVRPKELFKLSTEMPEFTSDHNIYGTCDWLRTSARFMVIMVKQYEHH